MTKAETNKIAALEKAVAGAIGAYSALQKDVRTLAARIAELDAPFDAEATNDFDEEFLIGKWMADQRAAGAKTVDLEKVEIIREGIRYALDLRTPV